MFTKFYHLITHGQMDARTDSLRTTCLQWKIAGEGTITKWITSMTTENTKDNKYNDQTHTIM